MNELHSALKQILGQKARLDYSIVVDKGDLNHRPLHITLPNKNQQENGNTYIPKTHRPWRKSGVHKSQTNVLKFQQAFQ